MTDTTTFWNRSGIHADPNPEIRIRILDHFWLKLDALIEVCIPWAQSSYYYYDWLDEISQQL